jgi:3-deoxy-D-manno-octulosonic-acid transferase
MGKRHPFWFLLYNIAIIPTLYLALQVARFLNAKIKQGIRERRGLFRRLIEQRDAIPEDRKLIIIHAASAGEFEAARPVLAALKKRIPDTWIHITCYSPSGLKPISNANEVDSHSYLPFDDLLSARRFFSILKPAAFIIVKHDVWPNMVWAAASRGIPSLWINANLHEGTRRLALYGRGFNRSFLEHLTAILTVSDAHAIRLSQLIIPTKITVAGDSRYDRTLERMVHSAEKGDEVLPKAWFEGKKVIVGGSTWGPDQRIVVPAFAALKKDYPDLYLILVPHEPHEEFLSETDYYLRSFELRPIRYTQLDGQLPPADVLVIDKVGILALLYRVAWVAYVGGAFGEGVHSVLEPAVYGLPLFFGLKYYMANEAQALVQRGGASSVASAEDFERDLRTYLEDSTIRNRAAEESGNMVKRFSGATERIVDHINKII